MLENRSDSEDIIHEQNRYAGRLDTFSADSRGIYLYFVRRGTMYLKEGDRKYEIREGEYILLQPGMTHVGYRESECSYYYIHFGAETLQELSCTEEGKSEKYYQKPQVVLSMRSAWI